MHGFTQVEPLRITWPEGGEIRVELEDDGDEVEVLVDGKSVKALVLGDEYERAEGVEVYGRG